MTLEDEPLLLMVLGVRGVKTDKCRNLAFTGLFYADSRVKDYGAERSGVKKSSEPNIDPEALQSFEQGLQVPLILGNQQM